MKKTLYIGDFFSGNGPSQVDINLRKNLGEKFCIYEQTNKKKILKMIIKLIKSEQVLISGISFKGVLASLIAKIFQKKTIYVMHGDLNTEKKYNRIKKYTLIFQFIIINYSKKIICVSEVFSKNIKKNYPKLKEKIIFVNNGIDFNLFPQKTIEKKNNIVTLGGGRREKGVLEVCKVLEKMKKNKNFQIDKLIVIGEDGIKKKEICSYDFVIWKGFIPHGEVLTILNLNKYFIQNSYYESFGISPVEAYLCGCKIILSENIPVKNLLDLNGDFICKSNDYLDIENKLENLMCMEQKLHLKLENWEQVAERYKKVLDI